MSYSKSIIFNVDSYKVSMFNQYPPNTTGIYSYVESRGGHFDKTLFFGLQGFIKEYLTKPITANDIELAHEIYALHGEPFYREGWEYILNKHGGYLPLVIRAATEGLVIPTGNVLAAIDRTDPNCYWLTTWLETSVLRGIWYPTTVATVSWSIKQVILSYLEKTGDPSLIDFKLHDFGARGASSLETAAIGGAAHLVNFKGTDTVSGLLYAREFYSKNKEVFGFSVPAMEHSTVTAWGQTNEVKAYENMLNHYGKPGKIFAAVSDSYDIYHACEYLWGTELRQKVIDSGATLVVRPDSGDPVTVCLKVVQILASRFGFHYNHKGYKVLNHVRVLQGDGVNEDSIARILSAFADHGWSADNIAFGMGGALLQKVDRDTQKFAMKCSSALIDNEWRDVQKDPVTDPGKRSKTGQVQLFYNGDQYCTSINRPTYWTDKGGEWQPMLREVFRDGELLVDWDFFQVRENSNR